MQIPDAQQLIETALQGDRDATRRLVAVLRPEIVAEIGHLLVRVSATDGRSAKQERDELVQDTFVALWERRGELLRRWDPARGRSLQSYVRLVARSRALDILRSRRRTPWHVRPMDHDELAELTPPVEPPQSPTTFAREDLVRLQTLLAERFSARDWHIFYGLCVEERPPKDLAGELGVSVDAIYQWRSRFRRDTLGELARALRDGGPLELVRSTPHPPVKERSDVR
jgi:RNA polymerase sigma factor (sigma-70 family)